MADETSPADRWAEASKRAEEGAPPAAEDEVSPEQAAEMAQAFQRMMVPAPQAWRPACVSCLNAHKIAIMEVAGKLKARNILPGTDEFSQAMGEAAQAGAILANNPAEVLGQNGARPDVIPPVREADVLVNGNSVCVVCFQPAPNQGGGRLLAAGPGLPGGGFR
jgi:hypothetical protein